MDRRIAGFHQDEEIFWVAELECGHQQHVRHNPPMTLRPWVKECFYRCWREPWRSKEYLTKVSSIKE